MWREKLSRENVGGKIITLFPREWRRKFSGEIVWGKLWGGNCGAKNGLA